MDKDLIAKSDPYCIIKCGPTKKQTTMIKNNLNPSWKQSFDFDWHGEEIIRIECWDHNKVLL
jgi:C2 domain.